MGRQTRNFRQTKRSAQADSSAKSYGRMNRMEGWNKQSLAANATRGGFATKIINIFKKGDKQKWQG